jgi:hypothetical protein
MPTSATPKKAAASARVRKAVKKPTVRKRAAKKKVAVVEGTTSDSSSVDRGVTHNRRKLSGQLEQLLILGFALLFGLIGLAVHFLWFISIVFMALLAGLIAADIRGARGRGIISEVVAEAKIVVEEISNSAPSGNENEGDNEDSPPAVSAAQ